VVADEPRKEGLEERGRGEKELFLRWTPKQSISPNCRGKKRILYLCWGKEKERKCHSVLLTHNTPSSFSLKRLNSDEKKKGKKRKEYFHFPNRVPRGLTTFSFDILFSRRERRKGRRKEGRPRADLICPE